MKYSFQAVKQFILNGSFHLTDIFPFRIICALHHLLTTIFITSNNTANPTTTNSSGRSIIGNAHFTDTKTVRPVIHVVMRYSKAGASSHLGRLVIIMKDMGFSAWRFAYVAGVYGVEVMDVFTAFLFKVFIHLNIDGLLYLPGARLIELSSYAWIHEI